MKTCKYRVIFGVSDLGLLLYDCLCRDGVSVQAFTVQKGFIENNIYCMNKPVIALEELASKFPPNETGIYICIGYKKMNMYRQKIFEIVKNSGFTILSYVHPSALISTDDLGIGNLIFERVMIGAFTKLGNGNICYPNSMIAHHTVIGDFNFFAISSSVAGKVLIGNNCFIGNNSSTKDRIIMKDYTLLGAGSYLSFNTNDFDVIVPAKSICLQKKRSIDVI